jgi:F420-dependent oxidoreductase-like protein
MTAPDVAVMIEGQHGIDWERWQRIARTVEDAGFHGLFRSDHFTNPEGPLKDSLELWTSLTWLADNTDDLEFGPLVTPASFRDPVFTARMGKEVDTLSDGRLTLGLGAGWQEREHDTYGYDLLPIPERFDRFEESLNVIQGLLRFDTPVSFDGEYYELEDARLLPEPERDVPILVGGNGRNRTLPLAARFADEWNGVYVDAVEFGDLNDALDDELVAAGRDPEEVRRSLMTQVVFGRDEAELEAALGDRDPDEIRGDGFVVGTPSQVAAQLEALGDAGADRVMLQWLDVDHLDRLRGLADAVV